MYKSYIDSYIFFLIKPKLHGSKYFQFRIYTPAMFTSIKRTPHKLLKKLNIFTIE